jgi:hypothetical protein
MPTAIELGRGVNLNINKYLARLLGNTRDLTNGVTNRETPTQSRANQLVALLNI